MHPQKIHPTICTIHTILKLTKIISFFYYKKLKFQGHIYNMGIVNYILMLFAWRH